MTTTETLPRFGEVRTMSYIERNSVPEPNTGCWLWTRSVTTHGYGYAWIGGQSIYAHRAAWLLSTGVDAGELDVCHRCDTPSCVNPDHLFLGTAKDNAADCRNKGRMWSGRRPAVCKRGHSLSPTASHVLVTPRGHRICRLCREIRSRARRSA